jgi:hypothetical protein
MLTFIKQNLFAAVLFGLAVAIGIYTRLVLPQLAYTEFLGEQAREAFLHIKIAENGLPAYGPISSIGKYYIPGGYYAIFYLFSFFSNNPSIHIFSNSVFSFLTIPLFGFLIYRTFFKLPKVNLISAFASLMWSIFANDIYFAGFVWNPNSATFFWIFLVVNYELILNGYLKNKLLPFFWILQGIILGILISLHSSALFIVPIIFLINTLFVSYRIKSFQSLWSILGFFGILFPYFDAEIKNKFKNSTAIIDVILNQTKEPHTLVEKLNHIFDPIISLANNVYFAQTNMSMFNTIVIVLVIVLGIIFYKGKGFYLFNYLLVLFLFLLAANSYWGNFFRHYLVLIWSLPLFFSISLLFLNPISKVKRILAGIILICGFGFFAQQNLEGINNIYQNKFGQNRVINISDLKIAISRIPLRSTICSPLYGDSLSYLATVGNINIKTLQICNELSDFELVENYKTNDFNPSIKNSYDLSQKNIYFETNAFTIIKLK